MFELSFLCVDRTFLLIFRDPSCVEVGNMPSLLVVRDLDRGTHLLRLRDQYYRMNNGIDGSNLRIKQFASASCFFYFSKKFSEAFL